MLRTLKKSISALLAAMMIISCWAIVMANSGESLDVVQEKAAGNASELYDIEVIDSYDQPYSETASRTWTIDGKDVTYNFRFDFTYSSRVSHGRYVNNTIYLDQRSHHDRLTLQQFLDKQGVSFALNLPDDFYDSSTGMYILPPDLFTQIDPFGLRDGQLDSDEYGVILHVKVKNPSNLPLSVVSENPSSGSVKTINLLQIEGLGNSFDKYYFLSADLAANPNSFITVSQGQNTGVYSIPLVKGVPWTRTYVQETELYEQSTDTEVVASFDPEFGGINPGAMNYIDGYKMHFNFVRRGTENGAATNDIVEYKLFNTLGQDISEYLSFVYDNDSDPSNPNYKKTADITISGMPGAVGSKCILRLIIRSVAYDSIKNSGNDLARVTIPIELTKADEKPIQTIKFAKPEYILTTGNNNNSNTLDLSLQLTVNPNDTTDRVVYESSNPQIATVDSKTGKVTALRAGETTVTAYGKFKGIPYSESYSATCKIIVKADITDILIDDFTNDGLKNTIVQGHDEVISYRVSPESADKSMIQWTSNDENHLTVSGPDKDGVVRIYAPVTDDWGTNQNQRTVVLTAETTVGNHVSTSKTITIKRNVSATRIDFTAENYSESTVNLQKSCQAVAGAHDEYNIFDDQKVKITASLSNSGVDSTDKLLWRLTVDDGSLVKDVDLSTTAAKNYIATEFDASVPKQKSLIVHFNKDMHNTIKLTAYAVSESGSINDYHSYNTIIFHSNTKTAEIQYQAPSGRDFSEMAVGDVWTLKYFQRPNDDTNIDDLCVRSTNDNVVKIEVDKDNSEFIIRAVGTGSAQLYVYATYNKDLTLSSDYKYFTQAFTKNVKVKRNIEDATLVKALPSRIFKNANYTVNDIAGDLTLKYNGQTLDMGHDYKLDLINPKNVGVCTVLISAIPGNNSSYAGAKEVTFDITPYDLSAEYSDVTMTVNNPTSYTYTGKELNATATVKVAFANNSATLQNLDYTLAYENNVNAGENTAKVIVTGKGNYQGSISSNYTINPRNIYDQGYVKIDDLKAVTYTGAAFTPDIVARNTFISTSLRQGEDYTLTYSNNINAGNASVVITGIGNYGSTKTMGFNIKARDIKDENITVAAIPNQTYNTKDIRPELTIKYNGMTLKKDVDYTANYTNNIHAGKATVTIFGRGNYNNGTDNLGRVVNFTIDPYVLTAGNTTVNVARAEYTGKPLTPNVDVKVDDFNRSLDKTNECTISHLNNIDAGNGGIVKVKGKGDYAGTFTYTFKIEPTSINNVDIEAIPEEFYDGTEHKPDIVAKNRVTGARLQANVDYYLEYENNINQGMAKVFVTGLGNYAGSDKPRELSFRIAAANIANATFSSIPDQTFIPGEGIRPSVAVVFDGSKLVEDKDYRVEYRDNYNVGTATMTFIGLGDFGGKYEKTFKIKPFKLTSSNIKITLDEATYDGKAKTPFVKVELKSNGRVLGRNDEGNGDYKVTFSNNVNAGNNTASVVITGTNNFTGSVTQNFSIKGIEIARAGNEGIEPKAYTGKAITPKVKLTFGDKTLKEGTDYKLSYKDNVKPGEATIVVTGLGNFFGTKEIKFRIKPAAVRFNADSMDVVAGDTKRMPFDADEKVTWTSSNKKVCTVNSNGEVTGKMAGKVTITGKSESGITASITVQVLYKDVTNTGDFWYKPTYYLTNVDVVKGYDNQTTFKPANECTRGQMVTFLWRLQGCPNPKTTVSKFKDVKKSDYFFKAVLWGNENHIVEGYKDGTFGPKIVCQRKHAVTFMWRLAGKPNPKTTKNKFSDVKTKDYFYKAVLWASEKKIVEGYAGGKFKPDGNCLRRQMVTFLYKYDKFVNGKG